MLSKSYENYQTLRKLSLCVLRHRTSLDNLKLITKKVVRKTDKCTNAPLKDTCADIGYRRTDPMNKENRESFDVHEIYFHLCILNHMKNVFISSPLSILVLNLYNSISAHVRVSGVLGKTFLPFS